MKENKFQEENLNWIAMNKWKMQKLKSIFKLYEINSSLGLIDTL